MSWRKISPELVVGELADEAGLAPERSEPRDGVRRPTRRSLRAPGPWPRRAAPPRPRRSAASRPCACPGAQEGIVGVGDDVDDRVADGEHVEAAVGHESPQAGKARGLARRVRSTACLPRPIRAWPCIRDARMRRIVIAARPRFLLLAGCATRPQQPAAPPPPVSQPQQPPRGPDRPHRIRSRRPFRQSRAADSRRHRASSCSSARRAACSTPIFIRPDRHGHAAGRPMSTRAPVRADYNQAACVSALEDAS